MSGIKNEVGGGERVPGSSDVSLCDRPWHCLGLGPGPGGEASGHRGACPTEAWSLEPASHLASRPQGEPRCQGSLAQVHQHLSAVPWQDGPWIDISLVSLDAQGPQKGGGKGKMRSHWPYITGILNSENWWQNLVKGKITVAVKLAVFFLFSISWSAWPHRGPSMSQAL